MNEVPQHHDCRALALAVASITALAACSSSNSSSSPSGTSSSGSSASLGLHGQFGNVPAEATGTQTSGTITMAEPPNSAPTWILPIVTGAANSVFTVPMFDYQMFRPLYWFVNGVEPKETPAMSLANDPTWSNGNKTVTFTLKSNYKWSDGTPITSKDVLFWYDEMKAAIKASPANWAYYTPGLGIPDQVASISAPNSSTVQMNLTKAVNPTWFWQDQLGAIQPMPSQAWAKSSASGPILDFTKPSNAAAIYSFLSAQSKSVSSYATNPLWQIVDGPYKLTSLRQHQRRLHDDAQHHLRRTARDQGVDLPARCPSPRTRPSSTRSRPARSTSATCRSATCRR